MKKERIIVVDVLRGFALLFIVLIHYVEHFDFFSPPSVHFLFSNTLDREVMNATFLLISGKAYSIFALLFGLSFFIQMNNKEQRGIDYRWRFLWRMTVLLLIGFLHSLIYRGDILHIYALLSLPVVFLYKVRTKYLWLIAVLLVIQLPTLYNLFQALTTPGYEYVQPLKGYFREGNIVYSTGDFWEVVKYNFWKGRITVWAWTINNGRYLQLIALFIVGLILGRKRIFENIENRIKGLVITLLVSIILFLVLTVINDDFKASDLTNTQKELFNTLLTSLINLAATSGVVALITLTYLGFKNLYIFRMFSAYGKMSLTNYISQAVFGVIVFYGFGFGMYRYLGSTWSIMIGATVFIVQLIISTHWSKTHYYGPVEWIWRCATNFDFGIKMKR
ncbi:MAG: DUF418 domain-containing protein [Acidobacteriota bacterium]